MAAILSATLSHCEIKNRNGSSVSGKDFLLSLALGIDIASFLGISAKGELKFFRPATASGFGAVAALSKIENFNQMSQKRRDLSGFPIFLIPYYSWAQQDECSTSH